MRGHLEALSEVLRECGALASAEEVEEALSGTEHEVDTFLTSSELWGGSGSIADQAGVGLRSEDRQKIEQALIHLGKEQIRAGRVNPRTAMWVSVFEKWERSGT